MIFAPAILRAALRGEVTQVRRPHKAGEPYYRQSTRLKSTSSNVLVKPYRPREGARFPLQQRVTVAGRPSSETQGHAIISSVTVERAGELTYEDARAMGYRTTSAAMAAWLADHDQAWVCEPDQLEECQACGGPGLTTDGFCVTCGCDDQARARFIRKHADRDVWVIRFQLDKSHVSRLLAAVPGGEGDADGDYVTSPAQAMGGDADPGEGVDAKTADLYSREGIQGWAAREASRQAERDRLALAERLRLVQVEAAAQGIDVRHLEKALLQRIRAMENKVRQQGKRAA